MGLATSAEAATRERPHTPKLAFVAPPAGYAASTAGGGGEATCTLRAHLSRWAGCTTR